MLALLKYLFFLLILWIGIFLLQQTCFLYFDIGKLDGLTTDAITYSYQRALAMDVAAACYVLLPVGLLCSILLFKEIHWIRRAVVWYLGTMIVLSAFVNIVDIGLFHSWGTKVNHKALSYIAFPNDAMGAVAGAPVGQLLVVMAAQIIVAFFMLSRIDHKRSIILQRTWQRFAAMMLTITLLLIGMRGGPQDDPIDRSWSYHSAFPILNLAALNGVWNVIVLLAEPPELTTNPYTYMPIEQAEQRFAELHPKIQDQVGRILTVQKPNVIMVMLESWTADVVGVLGGDSGVTPGIDRLAKDGLLFTNFYSTGFRTEQGLCALISGFPSQPKTTIIRQYGKFDRLPSIVQTLDSSGYNSAYYYAGDAVFANTRAYLESMGFDIVHDEYSFPIKQRTRWGAFDEELFNFHLRENTTAREPFFHTIMTSTSHEPFDAPVNEGFPGNSEAQRYRNTVHYTDRVLANFIDSCKQQPWYANTVIIIVADHGHFLPYDRPNFSAARHRIPFLITGGALLPEFRGTTNATYGSHVDLATTLLTQLGMNSDRFTWSKDLFDPILPHFAFWTFDDGFGIANSQQGLVYDNLADRLLERRDTSISKDANDALVRDGQALEQVLLKEYLELSQ